MKSNQDTTAPTSPATGSDTPNGAECGCVYARAYRSWLTNQACNDARGDKRIRDVPTLWDVPTFAELEARRAEPSPPMTVMFPNAYKRE